MENDPAKSPAAPQTEPVFTGQASAQPPPLPAGFKGPLPSLPRPSGFAGPNPQAPVTGNSPTWPDENVTPGRSWPFQVLDWFGKAYHWCCGLLGLVLCLAIAAVLPLLQFLVLGYFLEVSSRIARTGKIRSGFVGFEQAAKLAGILVGTWLMLWPITLLGTWYEAARLIDPDSETTLGYSRLYRTGTSLILAHILAAWFCGGKLRHFFWPLIAPFALGIWVARKMANSILFRPLLDTTLGRVAPRLVNDLCNAQPVSDWLLPAIIWKYLRSGKLFSGARDGVWNFLQELHLPHLFWLGIRCFAGTLIWLAVPVSTMVFSARSVDGVALLTGFLGIVSFALVATWLPLLQVHFAVENRFSALFELRAARETFRRAPLRHLLTVGATFIFSLPLFLLKIERIFPELLFLPAIVFILFMLPIRFISGWTYLHAQLATRRSSLWFRWPFWTLQLFLAFAFAGFVYLMRFVIWTGAAGLFDQHAFLVPSPFVEWPF